MEAQRNIILECDRQNSIDLLNGENNNIKYNNSRWTNQLTPIFIPKGTQINLENVLINIRGADSQSIEFYNKNVKSRDYTDNFILLETGFYMNNNGINTLPIPCVIGSKFNQFDNDDKTRTLLIQNSPNEILDPNLTHYTSNSYGTYENFYPFSYYTRQSQINPPIINNNKKILGQYDGNPNPSDKKVFNIGNSNFHLNPYLIAESQKLGIVIHEFKGFDRNQRRADGLPIFNVNQNGYDRIETLQHAKQFTEEIPIKIKSGFRNPSSVADKITLELQNSQPSNKNISNTILPRIAKYGANIIQNFTNTIDLEEQQQFFNTYAFQGKNVKVFNANFTISEQTNPQDVLSHISQHYIYSNIAVQNPIWYENGSNFLMNTSTMNFNNDIMPMNNSDLFCRFNGSSVNNNGLNFTVNYPSIILSRYRNLTNDNDVENENNYDVYSEALLYPSTNPSHPKKLYLEILAQNTTNGESVRTYNDIERTDMKQNGVVIFCEGRSDEPNSIDFINISQQDYNEMFKYPTRFIDLNSGDNYKYSILFYKFFSFCRTTWTDQNGSNWIVYNYPTIGFHGTLCGFQKEGTLNTYDFDVGHWDTNISFIDDGLLKTEPISNNVYNIVLRINNSPHIDYFILLDRENQYTSGIWFSPEIDVFNNIHKHGKFSYNVSTKTITLRNSNFNNSNDNLGDIIIQSIHTGELTFTHFGLLYGYCNNRGTRQAYSTGLLTNKFFQNQSENGHQLGSWEFDYLNTNNGIITIRDNDDNITYNLTPADFDEIIPTGWNYTKLQKYNQNLGKKAFLNTDIEDFNFITENTQIDLTKQPKGFGFT